MVMSRIADGVVQGVATVGDTLSATFSEPTIRLGVTGLARAGKTVFITSLVANMLDRGRMPGLLAAKDGRIEAAFLQPQPDDTVPRFDYENHIAQLTGPEPGWPDSTRTISELRLSLRVRPSGLLSSFQSPRVVHLDIVDYPGEWLLDLALLDITYADWSAQVLERIATRTEAEAYLKAVAAIDPGEKLKEPVAISLAEAFTSYLGAARAAGFFDVTPGRFLLPGDLAGSPVLTFAPLPAPGAPDRRSLWREMERRFEAYKRQVVKPFFRDHFARIDRQIVLVDALGAIHAGPRAVQDLEQAVAAILSAFRPGTNSFLSRLFGARRVDKVLFAATKADHLHHTEHARLTAFMQALTKDAVDRIQFAGAEASAVSLAALRATTEEMRAHKGTELPCIRGRLLDTGKEAAFYPGRLPDNPDALLSQTGETWLDDAFETMRFAPAPLTLRPGDGPPHIRLDRALQFLIGDRL